MKELQQLLESMQRLCEMPHDYAQIVKGIDEMRVLGRKAFPNGIPENFNSYLAQLVAN